MHSVKDCAKEHKETWSTWRTREQGILTTIVYRRNTNSYKQILVSITVRITFHHCQDNFLGLLRVKTFTDRKDGNISRTKLLQNVKLICINGCGMPNISWRKFSQAAVKSRNS